MIKIETINLEKSIHFDSQIDSIETISVKEELDYKLNDDNMSAKGIIHVDGVVKTMLKEESFHETIDVDIYAPFEKIITNSDFKLKVKDYSYSIKQNLLLINVELEMEGIKDKIENKSENVADALNKVNEIEEVIPIRKIEEGNNIDSPIDKVGIKANYKTNEKEDMISPSWATDLFVLEDSYSTFTIIHMK